MKVVSLFAGGGGLDLGFQRAGFEIIWANEFDPKIWATYRHNHPTTPLDTRSICDVASHEIPDADGIIGGPSCQAWSAAGNNKGFDDSRGQVFMDYLRIIRDKQPKFFLIENVEGLLRKTHKTSFEHILKTLGELGYQIEYKLLNAVDYEVPQDRKRVIFVGIRSDLKLKFVFPVRLSATLGRTMRDTIIDLQNLAAPYSDGQITEHSYLNTGWSSQFMSRNRVRTWDEASYTIPASARHVPIHPQAPKMKKISPDVFIFDGDQKLARRFTLRECARLQTFPDTYQLKVKHIVDGYKILGNAVPVNLAYHLAVQIHTLLN